MLRERQDKRIFKVLKLQFSNAIFLTVMQQLTRFLERRAVPLR